MAKNSNYEFEFSAATPDFSKFSLLILDEIVSDVAFFNSLNLPVISFVKEQTGFEQIHFLNKPVRITELFTKIDDLLKTQQRKIINLGDFTINFEARLIQNSQNFQEIKLTEIEAKILEYFIEKSEAERNRINILENVWNYTNAAQMTDTGIVEVSINKLRKKLKEIGIDSLINFKMATNHY